MSNDSNSVSFSAGPGFFGFLTLLFVALKLLNQISWSWWWVLSPLWIPAVVSAVVLIIIVIGFVVFGKTTK